ncbi:MAG TPA: carboxypeptidase-like regulatory domain-containing protein [Gemmata sp.]|jgi:hypothetical protein|nr:carboxypeptidase-like regulatory domain-containing protein [Gemmata sp.]
MPKTSLSLIKQCLAVLMFASPLLSCGCSGGGSSGPTNFVKGKCMMNGQPVSGDVILVSADKKEYKTTVALNGDFSIPNPPKGEYTVLVKGMGMGIVPGGDKNKKGDPSGTGAGTLKGVEPPAKYAKADNGLPKIEYKGGEFKYDIELTP